MKNQAKRVDIISLRQVKERSILYPERKASSPQDAGRLFRRFLDGIDREAFVAAFLNCKNEINSIQLISLGSVNASIVHPREVFKGAIVSNASSIICCHNHPSGNVLPSNEDTSITKRLIKAGEIIGIPVIDHLIINSDGDVYSFKEENKL